MKIIIAGGGKVGRSLTRDLVAQGHDILLIDTVSTVLNSVSELYDVMTLQGNCASMQVLRDAGVDEAQLLIAVTDADEVNLLCCVTGHKLNAQLHTIARVRDPEYTEQVYEMQDIFGLSMTVNPERYAALEITQLIRYPGFLKRDSFAKGRIEIVELRLEKGSPLIGAELKAFPSLVKCRALICAVLRGGEISMPDGNFVLGEGDRIYLAAPLKDMSTLLRNLGIIARRAEQVMICGGGRISYYLAQLMERSDIRVRIVEQDPAVCDELARNLPKSTVICGDVSRTELLSQEGLDDCDALVALTNLDELNILLSLFGKSRGIPQLITKQGHNDQTGSIIEGLSLGSLISPRDLCCNYILRYVRHMRSQDGTEAITVQTIADGKAQAIEFPVTEDTPYLNIALRDLPLRKGILVAAVCRGKEVGVAVGSTSFHVGDTVIVVTRRGENLTRLRDIFL